MAIRIFHHFLVLKLGGGKRGFSTNPGLILPVSTSDNSPAFAYLSAGSKLEALGDALNANDLDEAFEQAHALKGVCANLALTPLEAKISEITELLRAHTQMDYTDMYKEIMQLFNKIKNNE